MDFLIACSAIHKSHGPSGQSYAGSTWSSAIILTPVLATSTRMQFAYSAIAPCVNRRLSRRIARFTCCSATSASTVHALGICFRCTESNTFANVPVRAHLLVHNYFTNGKKHTTKRTAQRHSDIASLEVSAGGVCPGNAHEKWQEQQQWNAQQNEWGRKIFQRQYEKFKTRANGQRAPRPPSPPPPPPHPTQKPQEPAPLDIDNLLEDLVADFCR